MKYAIIGTGAIGGYYGGKLAKAGNEVHFLLHTDYEYVKEHGLQIDSCNGNFHLQPVHAYQDVRQMPSCDVVLVCLKSTNEHLLPTLLPQFVGNGSVIVLIQNGIGLEADVQQMFPTAQLVAGLAFICSGKVGPGHIDHQFYGSINLGNYSCQDETRFQQIIADFIEAGIEAHRVEYQEARWKKAVWNMPFNGMTVAMNATTAQLLAHPSTEQLVYDQMLEVIGAAQALGVQNIDKAFADKMMSMTKAMVPYKPSMKLDADNHRPMEIDYLYSRPIAEALRVGFHMKKLEMLEQQLCFIQNRYASSSDSGR